jgi:alginate biosynthesis protein AlgK
VRGWRTLDPFKAKEIIDGLLAAQGVPSAFYRIATIYGGGKGICHDQIKAYAYASIAVERGELGARKYLRELDGKLAAGDRERALQARAGILEELEATL